MIERLAFVEVAFGVLVVWPIWMYAILEAHSFGLTWSLWLWFEFFVMSFIVSVFWLFFMPASMWIRFMEREYDC